MERMTREQMIAEFGEPGVQNPALLDLIRADSESGSVVLTMFERRRWGADRQQLQQIAEKINRYMGYALDGHLAQHYPQYEGKHVRICLECVEAPSGEAMRFVEAAEQAMRAYGIAFEVKVVKGIPAPAE
jgi:uncharacterized protein DUF6572